MKKLDKSLPIKNYVSITTSKEKSYFSTQNQLIRNIKPTCKKVQEYQQLMPKTQLRNIKNLDLLHQYFFKRKKFQIFTQCSEKKQ